MRRTTRSTRQTLRASASPLNTLVLFLVVRRRGVACSLAPSRPRERMAHLSYENAHSALSYESVRTLSVAPVASTVCREASMVMRAARPETLANALQLRCRVTRRGTGVCQNLAHEFTVAEAVLLFAHRAAKS